MQHAVVLPVLLEKAVVWTQDTESRCFFFSLTKQNRCRQSGANILSFSFPRGKVPFPLPGGGRALKIQQLWIIA